MKKKVLLSVFAASLFAAPVALAADELVNVPNVPGQDYVTNVENNSAKDLLELKESADKGLEEKAVKATEKANGLKAVPTKDGYKLVGKGQAAKAPAAKAGQKTLPKTHAVK